MDERSGSMHHDTTSVLARGHTGSREPSGLLVFAALACGTTWLLAFPFAWQRALGTLPEPWTLALTGLSAFGPTFAAYVVARREGTRREVFGRFRAHPGWVAVGLLAPLGLHLVARLLEHALGGEVTRWFWRPATSAQVAALFLFPLGEELGWRGFAHGRFVERYGPVLGPLVLGGIWGSWHLLYAITPEGNIELGRFALGILELMAWSLIIAWLYERAARGLLVPIAVHAGAHLDNAAQVPTGDVRQRALVLGVLALTALLAARSLREGAARANRAGGCVEARSGVAAQ